MTMTATGTEVVEVPQRSTPRARKECFVLLLVVACVTIFSDTATLQSLDIVSSAASTNYAILMSSPLFDPPSVSALQRATNRTLVAYSGPTSLNESEGRNELYLRNFEYFLRHGIICAPSFDNVLVLTEQVASRYQPMINQLNQSPPCSIRVLLRQPVCYDMESVRTVFRTINVTDYDHLVYANCGVSGPKLPQTASHDQPWTDALTSYLNDIVKMVGLTINCDGGAHVQSFVYALDRTGIEIVNDSDALYNCTIENQPGKKLLTRRSWSFRKNLIDRYERGMSRHILDAGYSIAGALPNMTVVSRNSSSSCLLPDPWSLEPLKELYGAGRLPYWNDTLFWKSSRFITPEIASEINYTGSVTVT